MAIPRIEFSMKVPVRLSAAERGGVLAHCDLLDVVAEGEDRDQAMSRLMDALTLFVETCYLAGTLDQVLMEAGFRKTEGRDDDDDDGDDLDEITVPISLVASRGREALRR